MARFTADSASISTASAQVTAVTGQIRTDVAQMMAQLGMLEGAWTGSAALAFHNAASQWRATQAQVEAALDSIAAALANASNTYADAEARATSLFAN
ncbi:MAG: WXG100 family type VII secretion target [Actinomycetaceae bacterium]|nr:WXG100 family type VII secretion target [Actinomycetaceae bacterium]